MKNYIYSIIALLMVMLCPAQVFVSQAEYFWDNDPGTGNGTPVLATDGSFNSAFEQLTKTGITTPGNGLHKFSIRIKDNTGTWGPVFTNVINVQQNTPSTLMALAQAEYFWDIDPGAGNGTTVLAADGNFNSVFEQLTQTGVTTPGNGLHKFCIRVKDNTGVWGPVFTNVINVQQNTTSTLVALAQAEYFWDTDPGDGNGIPVLAADGNFNSTYEQLIKTGIGLPSNGLHVFNIRIKDNAGAWGPLFRNVINVENPISSGCWQSLSAGSVHSVGIKADGTLWAWGSNSDGQLGDRTTVDRKVPIQIGTSNNWQSVSAAGRQTFAIKTDGTLWGWGYNYDGQVGDGTKVNRLSPVQIGTATNWKSISAGINHMMAIKTDGTLWGWGYNVFGQLGNGANTNTVAPAQIGTATNWQSVTQGTVHTLAIKTNGTLWAWGYNGDKQLGDGTNTSKNTPQQIGTATNWKSVDAGYSHSVALKTDGTLWAWGQNQFGQIGDGTTSERSTPTKIGTATNWLNIAAESNFTYATKTGGTLWSWGNNGYGQLGNGTSGAVDVVSPAQIGSSSDNMMMYTGGSHVLVKNIDGFLKVCGRNDFGQLGDDTKIQKNTFAYTGCPSNCVSPTQFSTSNITAATATLNWAASTSAPNGGYLYIYSTNPIVGGIDGTTTSTAANLTNLLPNTTYYWWVASHCGSSQSNWMQGGSFKTLPAATTGCWKSVRNGDFHSIGLKTDGTLWAWGRNDTGQLGDGTTNSKDTPVQIGTSNNWSKIIAGDSFSAGLKTDGTLWAWGSNLDGQLGDGTTINRMIPAQIGTATDWVSIASGDDYILAIKSNGTLWGWGRNDWGQLGDGTTINKTVPTQIGTATDWKMVAPGIEHTLAVKTNGTLWAWGSTTYGRLGNGISTMIAITSPIQIETATDWKSVGAGYLHSVGVKTDGTLWGWGHNSDGQLGDGATASKATPTQIGTETNWRDVDANRYHSSMGIKADGTFWGWGYNESGQLGDGTKNRRFTPTQIGTSADNQSMALGSYHTFVINTNGFLSGSGFNEYGQLGDGSALQKKIFVPVGCPTNTHLAVDHVSTKADQLKVYPNPVQDYLTVSFDQKIHLVTVYNAAGQLVLTKAINDTQGKIDFSAFPSGVYLVKVNAANNTVKTVKIIKR
ncbi:T9SS C-terminal target domain-containing protein [Chryseobacterium sp. G0186]|uniref:RCC1 domain-containing protein n=1 Tax=Chryseobacterium sp. G0186 TaxID=2487064 RepID=UPI000F4EF12D|nr:T9SS type A sorting domain-containing protein [Chryseobacterium sp. G0186]AZA77199.1 T9SS C-terminal target domain-containing protein [Chryseobacterium sp. G0186]